MTKLLWMTINRHPQPLRELIRDKLTETGWEIFEVSYDSISDLASVPLESLDAVMLAPAREIPVEYMDRLTNCKLLQIWSSGYDKFNITDAHDRRLVVANNHGSNATSVAEHTMLMMLGVARRSPEMHERTVTGHWEGNDHGMSSYSLVNKTLGIVGLGNIGTLVAKRAEAFGMKIIFTDPLTRRDTPSHWRHVRLEELLKQADYVSLHVHLGPGTREMIGASEFKKMVRKPFLINASRAELVKKGDLILALENDLIRGVAMDAHYEEPTSSSDELFGFTNVFFSPHVAGSTRDAYQTTIDSCLTNIATAVSGGAVSGQLLPRLRQST